MPQAIPVIISAFQAAASYAAAATFAITGSAGLASFVANTVLGVAGVTTAGLPLASAAASFIQASLLQQLMKAISPKPKNLNGGSQVRFGPNPQAPRPFIFGRTGTAGTPVVATTHGSGKNNNKWLTYIVALSCFGPVQSIEALALNQVNAPITNGMVTGGQYANRVWCTYRNGEWGQAWTPTFGPSTIPEWTPNHRGAGIAHACLTYEYDTNVFTGGAPAPVWTVQGSTGIYNASTLSLGYSANPADVYYTLLRGIQSPNGNRIGVGLDAAYIDQARIAAWRAVCAANNWTCGGVWQITAENLGDVLRAILQSGGAEFAISDGKASVDFFTSAASAYTIRENDLSGDPIERPTTDRKARVSRIVPRFRSEAEGWELVPAAAVQDSTLDTEDRGRRRTDTMDFPYVSNAQQARQLAAYNLRVRRSPIVELPVKPHGVGIPCGARVTLDLPEYGISSSTGVVIKNEATATEGGILAVRLDPADLHTWALGQDGSTVSPGSMPRDPASTVQNVDPADWTVSATSISASGTTLPIIRVTGTFPNPTLARLDVQIKPNASTDWVDASSLVSGTPALEIRSLTPNTIYNLRARYVTIGGVASPAWVSFANVTTGADAAGTASSVPWSGVTGDGKPEDDATVGARVGTNIFPNVGSTPLPGTQLLNEFIPLGENQVVNSDLNQGLNGFEFVFASGTNLTGSGLSTNGGRNLVGSVPAVNYFGGRNVFWSTASVSSGNFTGGTYLEGFRQLGISGPTPSSLRRYATQVIPGERLYYQAKVALHGMTTAVVQVNFYDRDGAYLSTASTSAVVGDARTGGPDARWGLPSNFAAVGGFATVPANAVFAAMSTSGNTLNGAQSSVYVFACDYFVAKVSADQAAIPAYSAGPVDRAADLTVENVPVIEGPSSVSFDVDAAGNPDPTSQLPRTLQFIRKRGGVDVSASTTWEIVSPVNVTLSAITGGIVNITALAPGNSVFTVRSTHNGVAIDHVVTVQKNSIATGGGGGVSSKIFRDDTATGIASGTYSAVLTGIIDGGATGLAKVELNYLPLTWSGSFSNFQFRLTRAGVTLAETGVFNGIDGAGDIGDFLTEIQTLAGFYSVTAGTATWSLEARRTSGSGTINTALGELIVTQTPT